MMSYAMQQVKAGQQGRREGQMGENSADPAQVSLQRTETVVAPTAPSGLVAQWLEKYPDTYRRVLRAAARVLAPNQTHEELYRLLHCAPEEQK